ncbi:hypothetical protein CLV84_2674 [Neolewinella xylanilytica]|uniref:Uncharacterized protein n=1 Tax=Neolewinella xylanilytica TaxID=1514080 RepID=A0A2S6I3L6_9BACT|nr:hypothetical protein [Neolewinella xylanilytica]PPK85767.1 hypothetical protein CLV84_2674 [Neolewinella xylanilytica]
MLKRENLEIDRRSNQLYIRYRWRGTAAYFLLLFAAVWNGILLLSLLGGAGLAISVHLLIGLGVVYYGLCLLLNRTEITVDSHQLVVQHGPLPTFRTNENISSREVEQLYLQSAGTMKSGNKVTQLYALQLRTRAQEAFKLIGGISDRAVGEEIERTIEDYLQIRDAPVEERFELPDLGLLKKIIPADVRQQMEQVGKEAYGTADSTQLPTPAPVFTEEHHSDHLAYGFALCHAPVGALFRVKDVPYRLADVERFEWTGAGEQRPSRVLTATPQEKGASRQFYTHPDGNQWIYFAERPLDADERKMLGFQAFEPPASLRNGEERYYQLSHARGLRQSASGETPVEEWVYFSSRATTRFRAVRDTRGSWEVTVQEPLDSSYIEAVG